MLLREIKEKHKAMLMSKKNVVACGIGYKVVNGRTTNELGVVVSVSRKLHFQEVSPRDFIPLSLDGAVTDVVETGLIRALQARTGKWRPAPGGVSIGHRDVTAGTLGCLVVRDGEPYILSNNHVLANSNLGLVGDPILQPGTYDGGTVESDWIAALKEFVPVKFLTIPPICGAAKGVASAANWFAQLAGSSHRLQAYQEGLETNLVDAAIAWPLFPDDVLREILEVGEPQGTIEGTLGMAVMKSGRTTGLTTGQIDQVAVTVQVGYPGNQLAIFEDQLMAGPMCSGGDSGSIVLDMEGNVVGLLFAGSDTTTLFSPFRHVQEALGVNL